MNIKSKLSGINEKLTEAGIDANIKITKTGTILKRREGISIIVKDIEESKFIDTNAQIQSILRESLGYGTADSEYTFSSKTFELIYVPIENSKVASAKSTYMRQQRNYSPVSTPGCKFD